MIADVADDKIYFPIPSLAERLPSPLHAAHRPRSAPFGSASAVTHIARELSKAAPKRQTDVHFRCSPRSRRISSSRARHVRAPETSRHVKRGANIECARRRTVRQRRERALLRIRPHSSQRADFATGQKQRAARRQRSVKENRLPSPGVQPSKAPSDASDWEMKSRRPATEIVLRREERRRCSTCNARSTDTNT